MTTVTQRYDEILERILTELRALYRARLVACAVYGSVGRGTMREDSDIDLLVVARDLPRGVMERRKEFDSLEDRLTEVLAPRAAGAVPIQLSPVIRTPVEIEAGDPLFLDMVEDARLLYDPEGFLGRYLDRLRVRLRRLGARRLPWKGAWYWDLKPDYKPGEVFEWP